ncbi:hypothetical protein [Gimesia sp.]|uniref:hypothetical protein n=1 Tax=Gimesia sp. TaxID=2024833 RepID=UPI000C6312D4|nr:hypothetical protein [Gimesia sp.]MAX40835.1 hypothetical protein [Gimesia sp.]HBL45453.1 hypothetical protein [Planctomycetaceae bacterium]|tara:strand:- start:54 stop:515 length:462 start_codon:yes stop_codon:yes gene_type:complete
MATTKAVTKVRVDGMIICIFVSVLLAGLWMRSFTYSEEFVCRAFNSRTFGVWSGVGRIVLTLHPQSAGDVGINYLGPWDQSYRWQTTQQRMDRATQAMLGFGAGTLSNGQFRLMIPYWFPVLFAASLVAACGISPLLFWLSRIQVTSNREQQP